jgi:hypothetical protein
VFLSNGLLITICLGFLVYQLSQGAWIESIGILGLAAGLLLRQLAAGQRPHLHRWAWASFALTAVAMLVVILRDRI